MKLEKFLESYIKAQNKKINKILKETKQQTLSQFNDLFKELYEDLKQFESTHERFSMIMSKLGWPPQSNLNVNEVSEIVYYYDEYGEEATKKEIDKYFLERYTADKIDEKVKNWDKKKIMNKRMPIIKEVIKAHKNGDYYLSVATLLPQIEGIIADGFGHVGQMWKDDLKEYITRLNTNRRIFNNLLKDFYLKIILVGFGHGEEINSCLSRHAIVHGGDVDFGTKINSLKTILLLNYVQDCFNIILIKEEDVYHEYGCDILMSKKDKKWCPYNSPVSITYKDKTPCHNCNPNSK
ncbi:MAG TPA: hypothetical protein VKN64_07660 [Halanaerobiales bacterium]|nr:hypothetical protein [Halanaerobiales bacterium]